MRKPPFGAHIAAQDPVPPAGCGSKKMPRAQPSSRCQCRTSQNNDHENRVSISGPPNIKNHLMFASFKGTRTGHTRVKASRRNPSPAESPGPSHPSFRGRSLTETSRSFTYFLDSSREACRIANDNCFQKEFAMSSPYYPLSCLQKDIFPPCLFGFINKDPKTNGGKQPGSTTSTMNWFVNDSYRVVDLFGGRLA